MSISTKQKGVMAAIIIAGVIGITGVLFTGQGLGSSGNTEDDHADHSESEDKGKAAARGKGAEGKADDHADEGLVKLTDAQVKASNIQSAVIGSAIIEQAKAFPGEIRFNEDKTAHVVARLGGVVEGVRAEIGQQVRKGQTLAILASTVLSDQRSELMAAQRRLE